MVTGTWACSSQTTHAKPGVRITESIQPLERVVTVGVRRLMSSGRVPGAAPTAASITITRGSLRNSRRSQAASRGCGSIATT